MTGAITDAILAEWTEKGYARMSMEAVARRAGVGKSALYRRWESKQQMALAVLDDVHVAAVIAPDMGSLEGDLNGLITAMQAWLAHPQIGPIMADLVAETTRDPELGHAVETFARVPYRAQAYEIFDRANARGELHAATDREVGVEPIASIMFWRNISRAEPPTEEYLRKVIATICRGCRSTG